MALNTLSDIVNAVAKIEKIFTVGTVAAVDEAEMTCTVTPEDGGEDIADVPLRVMRYSNAFGLAVVPVVGTEVVVAWLDKLRPVVLRVQEWDKIVIQNEDKHGVAITQGTVVLGVTATAEPGVLGNKLVQRLANIEGALNYHQHGGVAFGGGVTGGPTMTASGAPEVRTWRVKLSP